MARAGNASGFTLFEVMISLLVLTTAIISTIALLPVGIRAQQLSRSQMFASSAAMTLMNNFHTPVDKFEGISRLAPSYAGTPGTDTTVRAALPYTGWAGEIRDELIQASPYQPNLEQQAGWLTGVLPVPTEIARRLDSNNDEIQNLLDQGGVLLYPDPNFMMGLNQGAAMDKTMQVLPAPEVQKLVFAVTSLPQQNALSSNPAESLPWYEIYPFPPEWLSMQSFGRETRRLVGAGGAEGVDNYFYPNPWAPYNGSCFFSGQARGGWPAWNGPPAWPWVDQQYGPLAGFKTTGMTICGAASSEWGITAGILSFDDGGHGRYEPVRFSKPMRPGQEQDNYFPNNPIDHPDWDHDYLNYDVLNTGNSQYHGNGFWQGRNWRFFANKLGSSIWKDGTVSPTVPNCAWLAFQKLAGGNDALLTTQSRNGYSGIYHRSGWLPVRAMLTNPDFQSYQGLQNMQFWEMAGSYLWEPWAFPWRTSHPGPWNPGPGDGEYFSKHPSGPNCSIWTPDDLVNLTWKAGAPKTVMPPATYEMRANYRDRAIDLWQAVMPRFSTTPLDEMRKNGGALVDDGDGGTEVDCNKYEFAPTELDKFKFIHPKDLDPRDLPIHPAQVLALSYLAHAAMMVTGYSPPFAADVQQSSDKGRMDVMKVPWECLNWTYDVSLDLPGSVETSLWATQRGTALRKNYGAPGGGPLNFGQLASAPYSSNVDTRVLPATSGAAIPVGGVPPGLAAVPPITDPTIQDWERPFAWNHWVGGMWDNNWIQQWPISQPVPTQGITKDALVLAQNEAPGATLIHLKNDTNHSWVVYPGDEIVLQISYYQWWYRYGRPSIYTPKTGDSSNPNARSRCIQNYMWSHDDPKDEWDGRYDPDGPGAWWTWDPGPPGSKYPNLMYKCQTFHVKSVNGVGEGGPLPSAIPGGPANVMTIEITPPLPRYPLQYNDAREIVPDVDLDPVSLHKDTLVRRVANPRDMAFARKVYEMSLEWAAAYAAETPGDCGAPRPANRQIMMDKPLALYDLFYDAGTSSSDGQAVRRPQHPPTQDGSVAALDARRSESFYRWMVPNNPVPDAWFYPAPPTAGHRAMTHLGPGEDRQDFFEQMVYNNQLSPPTASNDNKRFWLTKAFEPFHRCRSLTFWSADWKSYEDAETAPSAPIDFAKHGRHLRHSTALNNYDFIAPWVEFGHSPLVGPPESLYMWTDPSRQQRYVDVVGGESAGYLYQNWVGALGKPRSGLNKQYPDWAVGGYPALPADVDTADADPTNGQPVTADVHLGHWGADRNGNGVLDLGPVPRSARMKAVRVADFEFYDPVLRLHSGN